jgi:hypothetical protein
MRTRFVPAVFALSLSLSCNVPADELPPDDTGNPPGTMNPPGNKPPIVEQNKEGLKSGTRLKQRFVMGEDGSQRHIATWDSKLNLECAFEEAEDGKQRCLPANTANPKLVLGDRTWLLFRDAACSDRIAFSSLCAPAARYVRYVDTCGGKVRLAVAMEMAMPTRAYYRYTDGTCNPLTVSTWEPGKELRFYSFGAPVAPEDFVSGTIVTE